MGFAGDGESWLVIEVVDQGIGIEPELLPRIFDAFEQGGPATSRSVGGLGLGLAISRSIVEQHQGRLIASSRGPGQGATLTLEMRTATPPADAGRHRRGFPSWRGRWRVRR